MSGPRKPPDDDDDDDGIRTAHSATVQQAEVLLAREHRDFNRVRNSTYRQAK